MIHFSSGCISEGPLIQLIRVPVIQRNAFPALTECGSFRLQRTAVYEIYDRHAIDTDHKRRFLI